MRSLFFLLALFPLFSRAQTNYSAESIPSALKARASAVIRNSETSIEIKDINYVVLKEKKAVTVLNKNGDEEASIVVWYNKTRQIKSIKATIFNEMGLPIRKVAEKDFEDVSAVSNASLFEDSRIKRFSPSITIYPYTVEFEYEVRAKQTLILPEWQPITSSSISVEKASLVLSCNPSFNIRYKEINYPGKASIQTNAEGYKVYSWDVKDQKAVRDEPYSPAPSEYLTSVTLAPVDFTYQDINGSFTNWEDYGKWTNEKLLKGRDQVPLATVEQIKRLVENIEDPKLKAKKIYEFVQQKTRYISIQIGIGGYQPMLASDVDQNSYGDCKGLVNYTKSLLNIAGIKSYYTLVEAGSYKKSAIPDFASMNQFNHVILCIPFATDTTWIDCTSKTFPFGFLGDFTDDRLVLMCTEEGGKIVRTPKYTTAENKQIRKAAFTIDPAGNLTGEMQTDFLGWQYENREMLIDEPRTEQLKMLKKIYALNNFEIKTFDLKQDKGERPQTTEKLTFQANDYSTVNDGKISILLNPVNKGRQLKEVSNRVNPVYINRGYTDLDEITYILPEDYKIDSRSHDFTIEKPFGKFSSTIKIDGSKAVYTRTMQLNDGTYPPESYSELVDFYQRIADADNSKIILIKK